MIDLEIIKRHLSSYIADLDNLKKHKNVTIEAIKRDTDLLWIIERGLYLLSQNLFDMLAHIVSADFNETWDSYAEIGEILARHKIISEPDKVVLDKIAGFRNRLSHEYLSLDIDILVDIMNKGLLDFSKFLKIIKDYCNI